VLENVEGLVLSEVRVGGERIDPKDGIVR